MTRSQQLFEAAQQVMPGGVNSPVRACRSVGTYPRFLEKGLGSHVWDVDGKEYIDLICSWGPLILGHCQENVEQAVAEAIGKGLSFGAPTAAEVEMAQLVCRMTGVEMVRMVNSGTEAVMSALRLARGATGRSKIIKFAGCYHGHSDSMLVKAGSGALTGGSPDSAGVPAEIAGDTLTASYNDLESVEALLRANPGQVSAVIVEPVAANMGVVPPMPGFLQGLRTMCDQYGSLLIFDEVITGFRLAPRRGSGIFRCQSGFGDLWQNHRRRYASGSLRRQPETDGNGCAFGAGLSGGHSVRQSRGHGGGSGPAENPECPSGDL